MNPVVLDLDQYSRYYMKLIVYAYSWFYLQNAIVVLDELHSPGGDRLYSILQQKQKSHL